MKSPEQITTGNTNRIAKELLRENQKILLLPSGCEDLMDSNYEAYLDCRMPEGAICLTSGKEPKVGIGNGCGQVVLLKDNRNKLTLAASARKGVPPELDRILQHSFQSLEGLPNQRCAIEFVEWLYKIKPTHLLPVLGYFTANAKGWIIGMPADTPSKRHFCDAPIKSDSDPIMLWYRLSQLVVVEAVSGV